MIKFNPGIELIPLLTGKAIMMRVQELQAALAIAIEDKKNNDDVLRRAITDRRRLREKVRRLSAELVTRQAQEAQRTEVPAAV